MEALVFADRIGNELLPLTKDIPVPLLPVNGKPLIEHTFDDLAEAEVHSIMLAVDGHRAEVIEQQLGRGDRWGLDLQYVRTRNGETPTQLARRVAGRLPEKFLAMRGDVYRSGSIRNFRSAANNVLATQVMAQINGRCAQLCLCRQRDLHLELLSWDPSRQATRSNWRTVEVGNAEFSQLFDTTEFYLANIDGLNRRVAELNVAANQTGRDYFAAPDTRLRARVVRDGPVLIGARCEIAGDARLVGPIVLGDDVSVGEGAFLHACVVLPGTRIPAGISLHNAVVTREMAIGIGGNVICRFADALENPADRNAASVA
ncbi:MAG: NDP-sugar synthase [Gammaproteobacteria bacterium]|nr:NDP-sugar synthase [Gammaproteobacteria bacterium]NND36917.1 NDP-sugar synthase [Gammaproteobacteria bacterium]